MRTALAIVVALSLASTAAAQLPDEGRLAAEFRGEGERLGDDCGALKTLVSCATTLATDHPLHIAFGSIAPQNGFGFGAAFGTAHNPGSWRVRWSLDAVAATGGAWRAGGSVKLIPAFVRQPTILPPGSKPSTGGIHPYPTITLQAQSITLPTLSFFGLGPDTSLDNQTTFGMKQTIAGAHAIVPFPSGPMNLSIVAEANGRDVQLMLPAPGELPTIHQFNSETSAPGLDTQPRFLQFSEGVRGRPTMAGGRVRLDYLALWQQFIAGHDSSYSFQRWTLDLKHEFPIYRDSPPPRWSDTRDPNECVVDPSTKRCSGVTRNRNGSILFRALISRSQVADLNTVPFYFQQTLGGSDINGNRMLAAYDDYRFRGPHVLLFQESLEHTVGKWPVGVFVGAEQGQVALQRASFATDAFKHSIAGGLTLRLGGFPLVVLSIANGSEGHHFAATMSTSLLGGGSRPSLH